MSGLDTVAVPATGRLTAAPLNCMRQFLHWLGADINSGYLGGYVKGPKGLSYVSLIIVQAILKT